MTLEYSRGQIIHVCKCMSQSDMADDVAAYCKLYDTPALTTRVVLNLNFTAFLLLFRYYIPEQHQHNNTPT